MKKFLTIFISALLLFNTYSVSFASANEPVVKSDSLNTRRMPAIILKQNGTIEFQDAWDLPYEYIMPAIEMSDKFTPAINDKTLELNFAEALSIVKSDKTMGLIGTLNQNIHQQSADVNLMSSKLLSLFTKALGVTLTGATLDSYKEVMKQTFTNLSSSNSGFLLWKSSSASNVTYQYNLFFAVEKAKGILVGMPVGLTISANCSKKEFLGMTTSSKKNYSVKVKAIKVMKLVR